MTTADTRISVPKMPIMEIFGPTIQGEGMVIGQKTMFIRTGGCDYSCAWCDSAFTWDGSERPTMMPADAVFERLLQLGWKYTPLLEDPGEKNVGKPNFSHVTISGGNPALIGDAMDEFINLCKEHHIKVGLETQGSKWKDWMLKIDDLTISPKPPSSGMKTDFTKLDEIVDKLITAGSNFSLKVVVFDDTDYAYAKYVHTTYSGVPFYLSVGNEDPKEGGDISGRLLQKLDWLWDKVLADPEMNDVKPLPQLHTLVWANKRGV